jgi:hypothetical protein
MSRPVDLTVLGLVLSLMASEKSDIRGCFGAELLNTQPMERR